MYDLEYHKQMNKSHILPNLLAGAKAGVISQFVSDIVISIFSSNEKIVIEDIQISEIASYYGAIASGMIGSFLAIYMDPFAFTLFSTVTYAFVYNLVSSQINNTEFNLNPSEMIFDTGVSLILIYSFDNTAHNQYLRYQEKRHLIEPIHKRMDRNTGQNIFFIVLVNAYGFLKINNKKNIEEKTPQ